MERKDDASDRERSAQENTQPIKDGPVDGPGKEEGGDLGDTSQGEPGN